MPIYSKLSATVSAISLLGLANMAHAEGDITKVNHIIVIMQENHSFDNYFGALPYAPSSPYHAPAPGGACAATDHSCVDGLSCSVGPGGLVCTNSNLDDDGSRPVAFHAATRCTVPDLDHGWVSTHKEINYSDPNSTKHDPLNDGFVQVNDLSLIHI